MPTELERFREAVRYLRASGRALRELGEHGRLQDFDALDALPSCVSFDPFEGVSRAAAADGGELAQARRARAAGASSGIAGERVARTAASGAGPSGERAGREAGPAAAALAQPDARSAAGAPESLARALSTLPSPAPAALQTRATSMVERHAGARTQPMPLQAAHSDQPAAAQAAVASLAADLFATPVRAAAGRPRSRAHQGSVPATRIAVPSSCTPSQASLAPAADTWLAQQVAALWVSPAAQPSLPTSDETSLDPRATDTAPQPPAASPSPPLAQRASSWLLQPEAADQSNPRAAALAPTLDHPGDEHDLAERINQALLEQALLRGVDLT